MIITWSGQTQLFVNAVNRTLLLDPWFDDEAISTRLRTEIAP